MKLYLVVIRGGNPYPNDRFKIISENVLREGSVFSVDGALFSVIEHDGRILYCSEKVQIVDVEKVDY